MKTYSEFSDEVNIDYRPTECSDVVTMSVIIVYVTPNC